MKSNFAFLNNTFPALEKFGELAEKYLYSDSNSCLMKLGMIGEYDRKTQIIYHENSDGTRVEIGKRMR